MTEIDRVLTDFKAGKFVIVTDDENRENEGDLVCAATSVGELIVGNLVKKLVRLLRAEE